MICIECAYTNIDCLFYKFKSNYIKLSNCPKCGKVVDKYIEYDKVILFIDVLLLKPQAYRHLAYNVTESEILKDTTHNLTSGRSTFSKSILNIYTSKCSYFKNFITRYKMLIRLIIMTILFEVYLIWAYEEKKQSHTLVMDYVLRQRVQEQYSFFILKLIIEQCTFCTSIYIFYKKWLSWGSETNTNIRISLQKSYYLCVLLITIFISSSVKTFPILMLIWPYDKTSISSSLINIVGVLNTTEALKINTNSSYARTIIIVLISSVIQFTISRLLLGSVISYISGDLSMSSIIIDEFDVTYEASLAYRTIRNILN